jgi:hypothetical protein
MMKKFFITLLFLIIAGGVVFFFGWISIQIPPESYAVISSKTGGYEDEVITPGEFAWRWERLIPTNVKIHVFSPQPKASTVTVSGALPSSDLYAQYLQGSPNFEWEIILYASYRINPESLPELLTEEKIDSGSIDSLYTGIKEKIRGFVYPYINDFFREAGTSGASIPSFTDLKEILAARLQENFSHVLFDDIHVQSSTIPDMSLYREGKDNYLELTETENKIRLEELKKATAEGVTEASRIDILREYGKLLTDYPVLLDFLELKGSFNELTPPRAGAEGEKEEE